MQQAASFLDTLWSEKRPQSQSQLILVGAIAAVSLPLLLHYVVPRKRKPYPPGPRGLPIIGNLHQLPSLNGDEFLDDKLLEWSKEYGLVYSIKLLGLGTWVVICDPELMHRVYVAKNHEKSFNYELLTSISGSESLLSIPKDQWISKRKAFASGFSPNFLKHMVSTMIQKLERLNKCIDSDVAANKHSHMVDRSQTFTSDVIVAVAFGEDWGGEDGTPHPAREWIHKAADLVVVTMTDPMVKFFGWRTYRQIRHYESLIDGEMMRVLERRLADHTPGEKKDICSLAVEEMRRQGGELTHSDKVSITHQLKTFYAAGHDTTATTIAWCIWLLSQHDEVLAKLRDELKEHGIWTDASGRPPTYEDLQKCSYLDAVIKETLRIYPPVSLVSRTTYDDCEEWNGYRLSASVLLLGIYEMGRHPLLWKEPEVFRPERFLDGSEEPPNSKYSISTKFTAFSKGPRDCIGKHFAMLEMRLVISSLATRYNFDCVDPKERIRLHVTTVPANGACVKFRLR